MADGTVDTANLGVFISYSRDDLDFDDPMKPADAHSDARRLDLQQWCRVSDGVFRRLRSRMPCWLPWAHFSTTRAR
jgi:hypothetical protein